MRFSFTFHQLVDGWRKFGKFIYLETKPDTKTRKLLNQIFVKKWKLLAHHLEDRVPLVVRVPQVGNSCLRSSTEIKAFPTFV